VDFALLLEADAMLFGPNNGVDAASILWTELIFARIYLSVPPAETLEW
jgi:hypothetical protein